MSKDKIPETTRAKVARVLIWTSVLMILGYSVPHMARISVTMKSAGGVYSLIGTSVWQDSIWFNLWGSSFVIAVALLTIGSALRNPALQVKHILSLTLGFCVLVILAIRGINSPKITPGYFGVLGTLNAIGVLITAYYSPKTIRPESPWPGYLRSVGYMSFAVTSWVTCGVFTFPGVALYPELDQSQGAFLSVMAHIVAACWTLSWTLTALGFALERKSLVENASAPAKQEALPVLPAGEHVIAHAESVRSAAG